MIARRAVVLLAVVLAACGADGDDAPSGAAGTNAAAAPTADDDPQADESPGRLPLERQDAIDAAVDVRAGGCGPRVGFGTGSVVAERTVVTAAHVVAGADSIELIDTEGTVVTGDVVVFDPDLDLAVVRTVAPVGTPLAPRPDDAERGEVGIVVLPRLVGDDMVVGVAEVEVLREANITTTDIYRDEPVERDGFEIEGSIDPGDSGAMVVLPGGGAGIVWARSNVNEQRAWAIDLPGVVLDGTAADLTVPVAVGPCIR